MACTSVRERNQSMNFTSGARHGAHGVRGTYATLHNDARGTLHSASGVVAKHLDVETYGRRIGRMRMRGIE